MCTYTVSLPHMKDFFLAHKNRGWNDKSDGDFYPSARVTISKFWDMLKNNDKMAIIIMTVTTMVILIDAII